MHGGVKAGGQAGTSVGDMREVDPAARGQGCGEGRWGEGALWTWQRGARGAARDDGALSRFVGLLILISN